MKHILDSEFRYRPSFDTDVRKTFEKARRAQQVREREQTDDRARNQGQGPEARAAQEGEQFLDLTRQALRQRSAAGRRR